MAREISVIYAEIVAEKDSQIAIQALAPTADTSSNLMNDLTSGSKVAIWRLWAYIMAVAIYIHETYWDSFKFELEEIAANATVGTVDWYVAQCKTFQYGDNLVYQNYKYVYALIDISKQIVKRCAITVLADGTLRFKVAKLQGANLVALDTNNEVPALISYLKKVRFAGTRFTVFTNYGDLLNISYDVYYDPIIPLTALQSNVELAINTYISNLPFNAELKISSMTDEIQKVVGVADVVFLDASASFNGVTFTPFDRAYIADGGYFKINPNNPLSGTINYIQI